MKNFDLEKAVKGINKIQQSAALAREVSLSYQIKTDAIPNFLTASHKLTVKSDKKRLQQVLMNLQANALKFTKAGGRVDIIGHAILAKSANYQEQVSDRH